MTRSFAEKVRRLHKQRGFLLLEAIMAVTVITLGTIAIMRTYSNSLSAGVLSQQFLTASNLAEQIIWETVSAPALDALVGGAEGHFEPPNESYSWARTIKAVFPEFGESGEIDDFSDSGAAGNTGPTVQEGEEEEEDEVYILYEIQVAVSWEYRRQKRELKYQTAVMRKQPDPETEEFEETGTRVPPQTETNEPRERESDKFRKRESEEDDDTGTNKFNKSKKRRFRETDRE
ncbi:hypothetical protein KDK77_00255 [bacterium]|nr:hypothetical protein [bacterium]